MPNHVYNNVNFTGTFDDLFKLKIVLSEVSIFEMKQGETQREEFTFNFFNIISPDIESFDEYYGPQPEYEDFAERLAHKTNHWYDWNNRVWGTKWNAYEVSVSDNLDQDDLKLYSLDYRFTTAWSPPSGIIDALPKFLDSLDVNVSFNWFYEEEQGWGGEIEGDRTKLVEVYIWDIPSSHADYAARDNEAACICSWTDNEEDWFEDCPRPALEKDKD